MVNPPYVCYVWWLLIIVDRSKDGNMLLLCWSSCKLAVNMLQDTSNIIKLPSKRHTSSDSCGKSGFILPRIGEWWSINRCIGPLGSVSNIGWHLFAILKSKRRPSRISILCSAYSMHTACIQHAYSCVYGYDGYGGFLFVIGLAPQFLSHLSRIFYDMFIYVYHPTIKGYPHENSSRLVYDPWLLHPGAWRGLKP